MRKNQWNIGLLNTLFNAEDCKRIQSIPLNIFGGKDRLRWNYTKSCLYIVKSGYDFKKTCSRKYKEARQDGGNSKRLWRLNMKHKIKHFYLEMSSSHPPYQ